jgi:transcriptional regulator with XRE-family HTH domain
MAKAMTQAELARRLGISQGMVSRLCRRGMPRTLARARRWRAENLDPIRGLWAQIYRGCR